MLRQFIRQLCKATEIGPRNIRSIKTGAKCLSEKAIENTDKKNEPKTVLVEKDKNITLIGINRPQMRNAINASTASKICEAFSAFEADETSPIAVLYGVGGSFCAGFDVLELGTDDGKVSIELLMSPEGSVGPTRRRIQKPVICGINGYCVANGLELALMCDLRVMEETAVLGFFNRRFGVPVIDGGTVRLPAMVGFSRAMDLILTGRQVDSKEAHQMGIANRIVETGASLNGALELAHALAKFPQSALNHDRNSLYSAVFDGSSFQQSIQNEIMYTSKDIIEQMQAGIKWFNQTFTPDNAHSFLKRQKSMADWDNDMVAEGAVRIECEKQEKEAARVEAEKRQKEEKQKSKKEAKEKKEKDDDDSKS